MKKIIFTIIFIATQIGSYAQVNPKVEGIIEYLKEQNISIKNNIVKYTYGATAKTINGVFRVQLQKPQTTDSVKEKDFEVYKEIRRRLFELMDEAPESYNYECHKDGNDTVITTMALKGRAIFNSKIKEVVSAKEFVSFKTMKPEFDSDSTTYLAFFRYHLNLDKEIGTSIFDIEGLKKKISPLINDKSIKKHTFICKHDSTFNVDEYRKNNEESFYSFETSKSWGENKCTVLKFYDENSANDFLHKLMDCVHKHLEENPNQAYTMSLNEEFGYYTPKIILEGRQPTKFKNNDNYYPEDENRFFINTCKDLDGFYILLYDVKGDVNFSHEWKTLKEFNNGKKTYYKNKL